MMQMKLKYTSLKLCQVNKMMTTNQNLKKGNKNK